MKRILISNQKGGVGKTTLARNLGWHLATRGHRVLLVDADGQGNLSKSFFDEQVLRTTPGLGRALEGGRLEWLSVKDDLFLLPADPTLSLLEKRLVGELDGAFRLKRLLTQSDFDGFDLIFIDSPPSLGMLTANGLVAAQALLVPLQASLFSLQGTNDLLATMKTAVRTVNPGLQFLGVVVNGFDPVPVIGRQILAEIRTSFGERAFPTVVSKSVKIEEAVAQRVGVTSLTSSGTERIRAEIIALASELVERLVALCGGGGEP